MEAILKQIQYQPTANEDYPSNFGSLARQTLGSESIANAVAPISDGSLLVFHVQLDVCD